MFNYFRNCSSKAYEAVTSLPHDALQPLKNMRLYHVTAGAARSRNGLFCGVKCSPDTV